MGTPRIGPGRLAGAAAAMVVFVAGLGLGLSRAALGSGTPGALMWSVVRVLPLGSPTSETGTSTARALGLTGVTPS